MELKDLAKKIDKEQLKKILKNDSDSHLELEKDDRKRYQNYKNGVYDFITRLEDLQKTIDDMNDMCESIK